MVGYCTLEDLRRALRDASLPGDLDQDNQIAVDAITSQSRWVERTYKRHWYEPDGISEAEEIDIPTSTKTRDDEYDIPRHGGLVHGESERERYRFRENSDALLESDPRFDRRRRELRRDPKAEIRIATGEYLEGYDEDIPAYTRIRLDRKDVDALNSLHVIGDDGSYTDWVEDSEYDGGAGLMHRGEDFWARTNNDGISELYIDVHSLDDDFNSLSNAVYLDFDYGSEGIPQNVRRAVACFAAAEFVEEATIQIPENTNIYNVETLSDKLESKAEKLLDPDAVVP